MREPLIEPQITLARLLNTSHNAYYVTTVD